MKKFLSLLFVISLSFVPIAFAQETIQKTCCMSAIGYSSGIDELKKELLNNAKREAVSELFGELIKSFTKIENFKLTKDKMMAASAGFVRIKGDPTYSQGKNLGELCVKIDAYAKDEDFEKFKPKILTKKSCIAEGDIKTIKKRAEEQSKLEALIDYNQVLKKYPSEQILPLLHEVSFSESGFISNTLVYCTKVKGIIFPIEIAALTEMPSQPTAAAEIPNTPVVKPLPPPETGTLFQDFKDVRIEIESLLITKDTNTRLIMVFRYVNKTQKPLQIKISKGEVTNNSPSYFPSYLTDNNGNEYRLENLNGIGSVGFFGKYPDGIPLTILPGMPASASLKFYAGGREIGSLFSLMSQQCILVTDKDGNLKGDDRRDEIQSTFNVRIRNIKPTK